jgi:hypothetical protein
MPAAPPIAGITRGRQTLHIGAYAASTTTGALGGRQCPQYPSKRRAACLTFSAAAKTKSPRGVIIFSVRIEIDIAHPRVSISRPAGKMPF